MLAYTIITDLSINTNLVMVTRISLNALLTSLKKFRRTTLSNMRLCLKIMSQLESFRWVISTYSWRLDLSINLHLLWLTFYFPRFTHTYFQKAPDGSRDYITLHFAQLIKIFNIIFQGFNLEVGTTVLYYFEQFKRRTTNCSLTAKTLASD